MHHTKIEQLVQRSKRVGIDYGAIAADRLSRFLLRWIVRALNAAAFISVCEQKQE